MGNASPECLGKGLQVGAQHKAHPRDKAPLRSIARPATRAQCRPQLQQCSLQRVPGTLVCVPGTDEEPISELGVKLQEGHEDIVDQV